MPFSNLSNNQSKIFMSEKIISLAEKNQNDQLIPQKLGAAIKNNLYTPEEVSHLEISKESYNLFMDVKKKKKLKKNFMAPFYGWGSTTSRKEPL